MKLEEFEELKRFSLGHSIVKSGRLYDQFVFETLKKHFKEERFKPSHMKLFPHITFAGISIVELAKKLGISKQATSLLVGDLIDFGVLQKFDNPLDKRSFLVSFKKKSHSKIFKGMQLIKDLDNELNELLGPKKFKDLTKSLNEIIKHLETK
jgi:DNA-binding MarR family transcriptional regulator